MNLLRVVDHHASAQRDLEGLDYCHFDNTKSGAYLAWEAFHPDVEVPRFVKLVSDRDLWVFDDPDTILLHAALTSFPMNDFKLWSELADDLEITLLEGRVLLRQSKIQIKSICDKATMATFNIGFTAYKVVVCNATSHWSDVGNDLLLAYPDAEFAAVFSTIYDRDTNKFINKWSLRSRKDGIDVSKIAALFGGGGHEPAAGFSAALDLMPKPIAGTKPRQRDPAAK
jgi:oligoribonuclease NrnB/cAMP/cGMP phosphodiesterase (DHH superfamily)